MNFHELERHLTSSSSENITIILHQYSGELKLMFINASSDQETLDEVFSCFYTLNNRKDDFADELIQSDYFQGLINQFAIYFKRCNKDALVLVCVRLCNNPSFKARIEAFIETRRYNDVEDHVNKFEELLLKLTEGLYSEEQDFTEEIVDDLHEYYINGKQEIQRLQADYLLPRFEEQFYSKQLWRKYPFLELLVGRLGSKIDIKVSAISHKVYQPSSFVAELIEDKVITPIKSDPRTRWHQILFGYQMNEIRYDIIKLGQANFDEPYQNNLTAREKVLLYCYFNMRKHFFSSLAIYERIDGFVHLVMGKSKIKFIDLGCGPGTSGLAFKDFMINLKGNDVTLDYTGVDSSTTMCQIAQELLLSQKLTISSKVNTISDFTLLNKDRLDPYDCIILNASYLFASPTLDIEILAREINNLSSKNNEATKYFIFQNTSDPSKNQLYRDFKNLLNPYYTIYSSVDRVYYVNKKDSPYEPTSEDVFFEVLTLT